MMKYRKIKSNVHSLLSRVWAVSREKERTEVIIKKNALTS